MSCILPIVWWSNQLALLGEDWGLIQACCLQPAEVNDVHDLSQCMPRASQLAITHRYSYHCSSVFCQTAQHHLQSGGLEAAFNLLRQHLPPIMSSSTGLAQACVRAWLSLLVAAANAPGYQELQTQVEGVLRQSAQGASDHLEMAWVGR